MTPPQGTLSIERLCALTGVSRLRTTGTGTSRRPAPMRPPPRPPLERPAALAAQIDADAVLPRVDLANTVSPVLPVLNASCLSSSQPLSIRCCDDQLNPPHTPVPSTRHLAEHEIQPSMSKAGSLMKPLKHEEMDGR